MSKSHIILTAIVVLLFGTIVTAERRSSHVWASADNIDPWDTDNDGDTYTVHNPEPQDQNVHWSYELSVEASVNIYDLEGEVSAYAEATASADVSGIASDSVSADISVSSGLDDDGDYASDSGFTRTYDDLYFEHECYAEASWSSGGGWALATAWASVDGDIWD